MGNKGSKNAKGGAGSSPGKEKRVKRDIKTDYTFGRTIGKGGSCRVVLGYRKGSDEKFAIKIMQQTEPMNLKLYEHEINILRRLDHPNIIKLREHRHEGNFYIVTEFCGGGELFDRIVDKRWPITEKEASRLVKTMLSAIKYCHDKNVVHRDLKPENFVFKDKTKESEMVLIDFGCAKVVVDDNEYKDLVGTPYYLAPESAAGHKYRRYGKTLKASDVWSVGVIAYVLMTGRPPFNGVNNPAIFSAIIKKKVTFPSDVSLTKPFIDFVKHMLRKSPKQRYTVEQALNHPWVTGKEASDKEIPSDVIKVLRQFAQQSKLKKAITKTLAKHMGKQPEEKIKAHFVRLDKNNSGGLDQEELAYLLMDMGITKSKALVEAKSIIDGADTDGSGEIEFKEFAQVWQRKLLSVNDSYVHAVFNVLDENGDGSIDATELEKVLDLNHNEKGRDHITKLIAEVDKDGDGVISFDEFRSAMVEVPPDPNASQLGHELDEHELRKHAEEAHHDVNLDEMELHE